MYHKHAVITVEHIKFIVNKKTKSVINQIDIQIKMDVLQNRRKLISTVPCIRIQTRQLTSVKLSHFL